MEDGSAAKRENSGAPSPIKDTLIRRETVRIRHKGEVHTIRRGPSHMRRSTVLPPNVYCPERAELVQSHHHAGVSRDGHTFASFTADSRAGGCCWDQPPSLTWEAG